MKKLLLSIFMVSAFASNAQVTVFEDSFETYDDFAITGFGDWLTLDLDGLPTYIGGLPDGVDTWMNGGDPQAWIIFNPAVAQVTNESDAAADEVRNFDPHTGAKYAAMWDAVPSTTGGPTANNDFLVSPPIALGASNNELTFWVKSLSNTYGLDKYRVYVYTGTGTPTTATDFTMISGVAALSAPYPDWELKTFPLNAYSNQTIRIGIRGISSDIYMLMVDDFKVTSSNLSVNQALANKFSVYPNPANNVVTISSADAIGVNNISITDLNGRVVKNVKVTDAPQSIEVNVSDLSSGMYMMNISSAEGTAVKKIVKN
ncbi:MAG: T9SS type A sorting domain-containing protein [Flavobacterium sp.]|nr:MAG: T9SS type A sorting domain-containing protein [Flavobacterium sp.]